MFDKQTGYFEKDGAFGQVDFPFRANGKNLARRLLEVFLSAMAAMITFGFVPPAFLLFGVHFVSPAWQNGYVLITGLFFVVSVPASWTFRNEAIYRIEKVSLKRTWSSWASESNPGNGLKISLKASVMETKAFRKAERLLCA
jgi:hypothetical protein